MNVGVNQPFTSPVVGGVAFTNTTVPFLMAHMGEKCHEFYLAPTSPAAFPWCESTGTFSKGCLCQE